VGDDRCQPVACHEISGETPFRKKKRSTVTATLKLTHRAIGLEVHRDTSDVVLDGERVGSLELDDIVETPVEPLTAATGG
jgi:hypothetical protein